MPSPLLIRGGQVFASDGIIDRGIVLTSAVGRIEYVGDSIPDELPEDCNVIDATGSLVLPGLIDIHVNGGGGSLAVEGTAEALHAMARAHARFGTTAIVPTTISVSLDQLKKAVTAIATAIDARLDGARVLGCHLEGPFLSPEKGGAHRRDYLLEPSVDVLDELWELSGHTIIIIGLAPELPYAEDVIRAAKEKGIVVALAHSGADYETAGSAIDSGVSLCAHIFNAMAPLSHRAPGAVGAFLVRDDTWVELISDGFHVHPAVMELVFRAKGVDRIALVTDAVSPAGTDHEEFEILGTRLFVRDGTCFDDNGRLAGSALTMIQGVRILVEKTPISLFDAVKMASLVPARIIGVDSRKGSLAVGKDADIVIASEVLVPERTIVEGEIVYSRS